VTQRLQRDAIPRPDGATGGACSQAWPAGTASVKSSANPNASFRVLGAKSKRRGGVDGPRCRQSGSDGHG
jgi:hypothetical protein